MECRPVMSQLELPLTNKPTLSSNHLGLVPPEIISQTPHFVSFLFSVQFLILDLNLLKGSGRKGSGPVGLILALSFATLFAVPFCWMPLWPGTHIMITWFTSNSAVKLFYTVRYMPWFCSTRFWSCSCRLVISANCYLLLHQFFS